MKIEIKILQTIPDSLVSQVDQLLKDNESNNRIQDETTLSGYSKERFDNKNDRWKYIVAINGEEVIGIIIIFKREIENNNKKISLGGLGGVGTKKEYRGMGIASGMLREASNILNKSGCDIAYLDTDINDLVLLKIYGKLGFVKLNKTHTYLGKSGKKYSANDGMIAPIGSKEVFDEILSDKNPFNLCGSNW
ncbi:MAG TPA: GNAT family N-acetyltransferase [Candidatus Saccharimonadales bacterium]|nr:GNAT family N-acetyltransferase [Candidatus Saccharimonadales bacterium]